MCVPVISGKKVFEYKATYGIPFDIVFERLLVSRKVRIDWIGFMLTARENGWWDFQTLDAIEVGLQDADVSSEYKNHVVGVLKNWIVANPHPRAKPFQLPDDNHLNCSFHELPESVKTDDQFLGWINAVLKED